MSLTVLSVSVGVWAWRAEGEAHERVERGGRSWPVFAQQVWAAGSSDCPESERDDERVVELAGDRDEVGRQVEGHREVADQRAQQQLVAARDVIVTSRRRKRIRQSGMNPARARASCRRLASSSQTMNAA
jgi:hypothetical protein